MDDQAADHVIITMENESDSSETLDLSPSSKPDKLLLKLKISKNFKHCGGRPHICPVCSKEFNSGKALGGHIRIHMKGNNNGRHRKISKLQHRRNIHRVKFKKRISKNLIFLKDKDSDGVVDKIDQEDDKVSCCVCKKDFKSMKSLFGHMRNHPERSWRGIRPPPSEKNNSCSSVSEDDEAPEVGQISLPTENDEAQTSFATEKDGSDLLKSLPKWNKTGKREGKFINSDENEIVEAAYCLMKLARGEDSFNLSQSDVGYRTDFSSPTDKGSMTEGKGKAKLKIESDQERSDPSGCKWGDLYWHDYVDKKMGKLLAKGLNCDELFDTKTMVRENKMKAKYADAEIIENNSWFYQFQKFPMKPVEEEGDPSVTEGRHKGRIFPSSQRFGFNPKNPSGGHVRPFEAPAPAAEGKHICSKTLFPKTASQAAEGSYHQVCSSPMKLDVDLNEPYVALDGEARGT